MALRRSICALLAVGIILGVYIDASGWGANAHRFINRSAVYHLPGQMLLFIQDSSFFATHASDADNRRVSGDTSFYAEGPRHYLDIDNYPNFHNLPRSHKWNEDDKTLHVGHPRAPEGDVVNPQG